MDQSSITMPWEISATYYAATPTAYFIVATALLLFELVLAKVD